MGSPNVFDDQTSGGLKDRLFNASCPPDIQPNTRTVALCSAHDYPIVDEDLSSDDEATKGSKIKHIFSRGKDIFSASRREQRKVEQEIQNSQKGKGHPQLDGWFFSDFYLFHHIFSGMGANQLWLTCEDPDVLVAKYGEYAHGDATDHRVVLDKSILPQKKAANNTHVFKRLELRDHFLRILDGECKIADQNSQHLLLLLFAHGDVFTFGLSVGVTGWNKRTKGPSPGYL